MNTKKTTKLNQEEIVNFLKNYGFVFANSEIYGGLANSWDYGPLGVLLKQNLKKLWWDEFVTKNHEAVGLDAAILSNNQIWAASGHLTNFSDPLVDCKKCHNRYRADKLFEEQQPKIKVTEQTDFETLNELLKKHHITCPNCQASDWTSVRKFNLMFKTHQGVLENDSNAIFLRPETAQGIFTNFLNVQRALRLKLPFAIGQIGKSFRNEITPGNFIFRTREFEQMELEYFVNPKNAQVIFDKMLKEVKAFLFNTIQLQEKHIRFHEHSKEELSHYSAQTIDVEYEFPHGWGELWGIANRTDFDLQSHIKASNANLWYFDQQNNEKIIPYVVEPSVGVERLFYAIICDKYEVQQLPENDTREVLHLPYLLAPYKVAILPLVNKLIEPAHEIYIKLTSAGIPAVYDSAGSIGKRYRRQDAIGTPYCLTFDFDSLNDQMVTIRNRDDMKQKRIKISELSSFFLQSKHE